MNTMLQPLGHTVLVEVEQVKTDTDWGFQIITDSDKKKLEQAGQIVGTVVAIGNQAWKAFSLNFDGEPWAEVGDKVFFSRYAGKNIQDPETGKMYLLLNDEDIRARIIEEEK